MKFIDPRIDFAFKKIFGSEDAKDILISFLESLLGLEGDKRLKSVTIINPYLEPRIQVMKTSILDVKCRDFRNITYIVEMQMRKVRAFLKRIQYNASKAYVNQIAKAEDYPKLNQVIAVTITDFKLFDSFDHYVSCHICTEAESGQQLLKEIIFYFIELAKFTKEYDELETVLEKWTWFIKWAGDTDTIPESLQEDVFSHAYEKARVANMTPEELEHYDKAGMDIADAKGAIELAKDEGREEGRIEGKKEGEREKSLEIAAMLIKKGLEDEEIAAVTGLALDIVKNLRVY